LLDARLFLPCLALFLLPALSPKQADAYKTGEAVGTVSGFQILHQTFRLDAEDPAMVQSIVFDIAGEIRPYRVWVMLSDHGIWIDCGLTSAGIPKLTKAQCEVGREGGIPVHTLQSLRVIATGG